MAKAKKDEEVKTGPLTDKDILSRFLEQNESDHFNFVEEKYFKIIIWMFSSIPMPAMLNN